MWLWPESEASLREGAKAEYCDRGRARVAIVHPQLGGGGSGSRVPLRIRPDQMARRAHIAVPRRILKGEFLRTK